MASQHPFKSTLLVLAVVAFSNLCIAADKLAYDPSLYEVATQYQHAAKPWDRAELKQEILERATQEKGRKELDVYYYRIGHTLAFPLPLAQRPENSQLPPGIPNMTYPWMIWLSWDLEERWRMLHAAWRHYGDREAGLLLQNELAALAGWDRFHETRGDVGLMTAHLAASLSLGLADTSKWNPEKLRQARTAANELIERDIWPWFEKNWNKPAADLKTSDLHNIPVITLARSAQLAKVIGSSRQEALENKARQVVDAWCQFRVSDEYHNEGTAYDGYLMDSVTEWIEGLPDRKRFLKDDRAAYRSLVDQWMQLTLPGRFDLHAPFGDVEPEMTFWATAMIRLATWFDWQDAKWVLKRFQLSRMRSAALVAALEQKLYAESDVHPPIAEPREHLQAITLRTGWNGNDILAAIGLSRSKMGHLHSDTGQLVIGWETRFWITDPGYQQYRKGEERDYTIGVQAHNAPIINGVVQTLHGGAMKVLETDQQGRQHTQLDLTSGYKGLPRGTSVKRDVWLSNPGDGQYTVVLCDQFDGFKTNLNVAVNWQGGTQLAWAFRRGWARLSDGKHALWMGAYPSSYAASALTQHPGSRGPLTLSQTVALPEGKGKCWWVFCCDPSGNWEVPILETTAPGIQVRLPNAKNIQHFE